MLAAPHLGDAHPQCPCGLGVAVRLPVGKSQPILQQPTIKIIEATKQLRSKRLPLEAAHPGELLGTVGHKIGVERIQRLRPLVADQL